MELTNLKRIIRNGEYRYSDHAVKKMISRSIDRTEVQETIMSGEIIEEYPDDKYSKLSGVRKDQGWQRSSCSALPAAIRGNHNGL
jgi:hypothetical protein